MSEKTNEYVLPENLQDHPQRTLLIDRLTSFSSPDRAVPNKHERHFLAALDIAEQVGISRIYPFDETGVLAMEQGAISRDISNREVLLPQDEMDKRRFLGLTSEEDLVHTLELELVQRLTEKGFGPADIELVQSHLSFAKNTDIVREELDRANNKEYPGKRRTGESAYVHVLEATWLLYTMLESEIETEADRQRLLEDIGVMLHHDTLEDLGKNCSISPNADTHVMTIVGENWQGSIELTNNQVKMLEALTRENRDDSTNGSKIASLAETELRGRVAVCKEADALANHSTMVYSGRTITKALGKLNETIFLGYLLDREKADKSLVTESSIPTLSLLAYTEKIILLDTLGKLIDEEIAACSERGYIWAERLINVLAETSKPAKDGFNCDIFAKNVGFSSVFELGNERPLEYGDFKNLANKQKHFLQTHRKMQGVLPGGSDSKYVSLC